MSINQSSWIFSGKRAIEQQQRLSVQLRSCFQQVENGRPFIACEARALKQVFLDGR